MNKTSILKRNIDSIISLTDKELIELSESFEVKTLKKNEFFLEEGQICNFIGFVNYGMLIYFKSMDDGNEVTTDFAFDGDWVTNNLSRLSNSPALINIKAIEDSELLVLKQPVLEDLYIKIPKIERLGRILIEQSYLKIVQLSIDLQVLSATERYERLLVRHPDIFQKVQLYHIANYIGIAPKSLSRIRKRNFDK
jgi:CRP-like cAMP-binding protein